MRLIYKARDWTGMLVLMLFIISYAILLTIALHTKDPYEFVMNFGMVGMATLAAVGLLVFIAIQVWPYKVGEE